MRVHRFVVRCDFLESQLADTEPTLVESTGLSKDNLSSFTAHRGYLIKILFTSQNSHLNSVHFIYDFFH